MAQQEGTIPFGGTNAKFRAEWTWDDREYVTSYENLLKSFTPADLLPNGFPVAVWDTDKTKRGIYLLIDKNNLGLAASWLRLASLEEVGLITTEGQYKEGQPVFTDLKSAVIWLLQNHGSSTETGVFENDVVVSLSGGKSLGRYVDGETIKCKGKTYEEFANMLAKDVIDPTVTLTTTTPTQEYNQTNVSTNITWTKIINSLNATLALVKLERQRGSGSWESLLLLTDGTDPGLYEDTALNPTVDNSNINYRLTVEDNAGGSTVKTLTIGFKSYVAPAITISSGVATRPKGDISTTVTGTITRRSVNVPLSSYQLQYSKDGGAWTNVGNSIAVSGSSASIEVLHNDALSVDSNTIAYRVQVADEQQVTTSSTSTVNFSYSNYFGYSTKDSLTFTEVLELLTNVELSNGKNRTVSGVTATNGEYVYFVYRAGAGNLTNIIYDDVTPIPNAFVKQTSDVSGTNSFGASLTLRIYRSTQKNAYNNNKLTFS